VEFSSGLGGSSEALFNLLNNLNRNKYDPVLLTRCQDKNFDRFSELGINVIGVPIVNLKEENWDNYFVSYFKAIFNLMVSVFPNSWRIWNVIHREKIDLVHINTNISLQIIGAAKLARIPCIGHFRENRILSRTAKCCRRFLDRIVVLNKEAFEMMSDGCDPRKVILIPDGLDLSLSVLEKDLQKIKNNFSLEGKFCIGILGRLVEGKGQDDFIQAAKIILKECKDVKFLIIGNDPNKDGSFERKLRSLVRELGLEEDIIFTGWRQDKNEIISILDVLVQASSTFPEGFGLTCIEAMSLGKPVVATNIPGPNSIVVDGVTGFLVPPADPGALAGAVMKVIRDPLLGPSMGETGKRRVEEYFDIKIVVGKIENMYERIFNA